MKTYDNYVEIDGYKKTPQVFPKTLYQTIEATSKDTGGCTFEFENPETGLALKPEIFFEWEGLFSIADATGTARPVTVEDNVIINDGYVLNRNIDTNVILNGMASSSMKGIGFSPLAELVCGRDETKKKIRNFFWWLF